jgi:diguanylate cyclase (GGDEF)-like protein
MNYVNAPLIPEHILILDNQSNNLQELNQILQVYEVTTVRSEQEAINAIKNDLPDLMLINPLINNQGGFNFTQRLKASKLTANTPIILIQENSNLNSRHQSFEVGAADYILKPFSTQEVITRIESQLQRLRLHAQLEQMEKYLNKFTNFDPLTKLANSTQFDQYLMQEWKRCARDRISFEDVEKTTLSMVLCQIDGFEKFQNYYGRDRADQLLVQVAEILSKIAKRPADLVARYRGEEFAILLPNTDSNGAMRVTEMIREALDEIKIAENQSKITLSYGLATRIASQALSADILIMASVHALEQSKQQGGNQITLDEFE